MQLDKKFLHKRVWFTGIVLILTVLYGCTPRVAQKTQVTPQANCSCDNTQTSAPAREPIQVPPLSDVGSNVFSTSPPIPSETKIPSQLKLASWDDLSLFAQGKLSFAWQAWRIGCTALNRKAEWQSVCQAAETLPFNPSDAEVANYFKQYFIPYQASNTDGSTQGLITGYYQPLLHGSRQMSARYSYPLYKAPSDLINVDLAALYPELKFKRVRGRLVGNKLVPYYKRSEIDTLNSPLQGHELVFVDDILDVFFLQIQGSGVVQLDTGERIAVGYAEQNGHAYQSIGQRLIASGDLTLANASMQGIKQWARSHLNQLRDLLNTNPSYVFFNELPANLPGPIGALGVPILNERVVAIDPQFIPLGAPLFLQTTEPNSKKPLNRLVMAQDTGGAIRGGVRADFFWGTGDSAGQYAGKMKQNGKIWVLLPKTYANARDTTSNPTSNVPAHDDK